jgi:predicted adenine nucleotide alpha hydrolase (AANH) superfamily ATPase
MRIALHTCCGPCLLEPFDALSTTSDEVVVVYANPNIHPLAEYERRRDTLVEYANEAGIRVVELPYDPGAWLEFVAPHARDRQARCRACYRLRLGMVARWAAEQGFDAVATTLTVSPYQDSMVIEQEGEAAAHATGVTYVGRDFRDHYHAATDRSRELGMYRQNYCGCLMSELEARQERALRKAQRAASKRGPSAAGPSG